MPSYARIVDGMAVDLFTPQDGFTLKDSWHKDIVAEFVEVPANVTMGSTVDAKGKWTIAVAPVEPEAPISYEKVSPMDFQMSFTVAEEVAIKKLVNGDLAADPPIAVNENIAVWWNRLNNPKLTEVNLGLPSVQQALAYLVTLGILTEDRKTQILSAQIQ